MISVGEKSAALLGSLGRTWCPGQESNVCTRFRKPAGPVTCC